MNIVGHTCNLGENGWLHEHIGQLFLDQWINGLYAEILLMKKYCWKMISFKKEQDDLPLQSEEIFILFRKQCYIQEKCINFMAPFYGWGSTASRLEPLRGGSLLFTTKFPLETCFLIHF